MSESIQISAKLVFVLIDGVGDVNSPKLGSKTPLHAAHTSYLAAISGAGLNGLLDPVEPGLACGSDTAHLSILGYEPRQYYKGRGAFESMGAGIEMWPGDIAFKCNFATLDTSTGIVASRRADRNFEDMGPTFCADLDGLSLPSFPHHTVTVRYATEHRCGVAVSGPDLSDSVSGTDPLKDGLPLQIVRPLDSSMEAKHTAALVNELSAEMCRILKQHPLNDDRAKAGKPVANIVLLRGCGSRIRVETFKHRHGMRACMIAPTKIIAGLGMSLGMQCLHVPGATGDYRTALHAKAEAAADALVNGATDMVFLHIKAVDDTGHDRLTALKVGFLSAIDLMLGQLIKRLHSASKSRAQCTFIAVTGDHSTPVEYGDHSHEPVPFTIAPIRDVAARLGEAHLSAIPLEPIANPGLGAEAHSLDNAMPYAQGSSASTAGKGFCEISSSNGALGRFPGRELMGIVKEYMHSYIP
ncbi:g5481 [Coccomyxa viridis]|uniref:G5481 protein n=1 Tax=Coccomyxa viridis TaxID=1274662 RepID=A0ABP1FVF5_9CHLO